MIDLNLITPLISTLTVGASTTSTDTIDQTKTTYLNFSTDEGSFPYPNQYFRHEITWDGTTKSTSRDVYQATVNSYDGPTGNPSSILVDGWSPIVYAWNCLLYTSPSPRDRQKSRMPSSA